MKKVIRLTESELTKLIKKIVTKKNSVNEQLGLLSRPIGSIDIGPSKVTSKAIVLRSKNPNTGKQEYIRYNIKASYKLVFPIEFDVELRNFQRTQDGDLTAEAKPTGTFASKLMGLLPDKNKKGYEIKTPDGWLHIRVTKKQLEEALNKLRQTKGQSAVMAAGEKEDGSPSGIEIQLTLAEAGK
jgi:hypothetical protein